MCIHLKIHHPYLLKQYGFNHIETDHVYFDEEPTDEALDYFVDNNLLPVNELLLTKLGTLQNRVQLDISGTVIELLREKRPDAIASLKALVHHKKVVLVSNSFYNSCCRQFSVAEYQEQVKQHGRLLRELLGKEPLANTCGGGPCKAAATRAIEYNIINSALGADAIEQAVFSMNMQKKCGSRQDAGSAKEWWYSNRLVQKLYSLERMVKSNSNNTIVVNWRKLQDVLYYSGGTPLQEGNSEYLSNIFLDLEIRLIRQKVAGRKFYKASSFL